MYKHTFHNLDFLQNNSLLEPLKIQWAPKWTPESTKWRPRPPKKYPGITVLEVLKPNNAADAPRKPRGLLLNDF